MNHKQLMNMHRSLRHEHLTDGTNPPLLDQTGKSSLHWRVAVLSHQGWWLDLRLSSKEWALHRGLYSGAGLIWRWRVRHGLWRCVTASSDWARCHCRQSQRCALQGRHPPPSCGTLPAGSCWHDPPAWQCHQPYCSFCAWFPARQECQRSAMASEEPGSQSHWAYLGHVGSEGEG